MPARFQSDVIVVGGGIAGLATTYYLAIKGVRVILLEREALLGSHSSGKNAAIFRHVEHDHDVSLALSSRSLLRALQEDEASPLLKETGALYVGSDAKLHDLSTTAKSAGVVHQFIENPELEHLGAPIKGGAYTTGLLVPSDGIIDVHSVLELLSRGARRFGATIQTQADVREILVQKGRVEGVVLATGEHLLAKTVVIAAGAWSAQLGETCRAPLPVFSFRRHLVVLEAEAFASAQAGVVWCVDREWEVYFRSESRGVLISPCDEEPYPPAVPKTSSHVLEQLALRLARVAPSLCTASVRRSWACLRSFVADQRFVAGFDPRTHGLFWVSALGGRGMTCGLGLGKLSAELIIGACKPELSLGPERLFR